MGRKANNTFRRGVAAFRRAEYELSVSLFTEAIELCSGTHDMFQSRSASLERLGDTSGALKDARKMIDLDPGSPLGYMRSVRLFMLANRPRSASRIVKLASSRLQSSDAKRVEKLAQLRDEVPTAVATLERRERRNMCHISQLPFEIVSEIMLTAVESGGSNQLTLASICSHWRSVALGTAPLWRTLRLSTRNPTKQLELWTQRSAISENMRGVLRLTIPQYWWQGEPTAIYEQWCRSPRFKTDPLAPLSLHLEGESWVVANLMSRGRLVIPQGLRSLVSGGGTRINESPLYQQLHHLELDCYTQLQRGMPVMKSLHSLRLHNLSTFMSESELMEHINRSSALRELHIELGQGFPASPIDIGATESPVMFASLRRLTLGGRISWQKILSAIDAPALTYMDLSSSSSDVCGTLLRIWARDNGVAPPLVHLRLSGCGVGRMSVSLRAVIVQLPLLEKLIVTDCGQDINPTLLALASKLTVQPAALFQAPAVLPCPRLQYVDFSRCSRLKGTVICDLVESRLAIITPPSQVEPSGRENLGSATSAHPQVLPIQTLLIDHCPKVPADLLPWLRLQVLRFSCRSA